MATEKLVKMKVRTRNVPSSLQPGRTMKMIGAICEQCQHGKAPMDWYRTCDHDPYLEVTEVTRKKRITEVQEDGTIKILGYDEFVEEVVNYNTFQVPINVRVDSRRGLQMARAGGAKFYHEMGFVDPCEYRDCWEADIHVRNPQYGNYCSRDHAALAIADQQGKPLDVIDDDRRATQLSEINV